MTPLPCSGAARGLSSLAVEAADCSPLFSPCNDRKRGAGSCTAVPSICGFPIPGLNQPGTEENCTERILTLPPCPYCLSKIIYNSKQTGLGQSAGTRGFQVEFKQAHWRPISVYGPAPNVRPQPTRSQDKPKHSGRPIPGSPTALSSANGRGPVKRETVLPGRPQDSNRTSVWELDAGERRAGQSAAAACGPRTLGHPGPAPRCCLWCRPGRGSRTTTFAGRRRRRRARAERRPPRPPSPGSARPALPGLPSHHVGEHGRAAAPGHDQPVRAGRGLRGRPGEAAAAGRPLAVRDRPEHVFPRNQHSQQPPPPPDDVYSQQHTCHTAQLPRCAGHVLQASRLRGPAEQQQPHDCGGLLAPCKLQSLLGLIPTQPPGSLDPALLPNLFPPSPLPTTHMAPWSTAGGHPAESHGSHGWPEMRLDASKCWAGMGGSLGSWGHKRVREGGAGEVWGFLKIALEDFIKEFLWVGGQ